MHSIQSRLALGLSVSLILLLLVQWLVVGVSIRYLSESYIVTHLTQNSETLLASITLTGKNTIKLKKEKLGFIFSQPFSGQYYRVTVADADFRSRSLWDTDLNHGVTSNTNSVQMIVDGPQQQTLLQITNYYTKNSKNIVITVAEDLTPIYKDITVFQIRYSVITVLIALILIAVQVFIVNKNLKPLDKIRRELQSLEKGVISKLQEDVPTEVLPLVQELNLQLAAFRRRLDRSRNATGNLAHALKAPLSLLYQLADNDYLQKNNDIKTQLLESIQKIEQNINRELKRARIAGVQLAARHVKLEPEIQSLIETLKKIYQHKNLNLRYDMPDAVVCNMDRQDLLEMLGNVLDNACQWATQNVVLTIENNSELVFSIDDDGPGCTVDEIKNLTTRGTRLDEQTTGHGLGLSIVQEIVDDYQGQLEITASTKLAGLCVCIVIPFK